MNKYISLSIFTTFWIVFAIVGWLIALFFEERSLIRCCVLLTAVCCWIAWLITFLMQMNPLIGPRTDQRIILGMVSYWQNSYIHSELDP
ncbi:V-type proton ATPase subunit e [Drosophila grimshawi]|uniref:GH19550 n=1 Tax=Drosophila grimshawi TaxID=7222 RepID=B4JHD1_DROGR|nr:V-type proton ATPase subunit e [Drosophila grimshawi]EDV93838.1 GH19550 [Drosophila grimshawi]